MNTPEPNPKGYKTQITVLSILMVITALLIITIPLTVLIYYWMSKINRDYREQVETKKVCDCVMVNGVYDVKSIAKLLGWEISKTRGVLNRCLKNHYLDDYLLVGDVLKKTDDSTGIDVSKASTKKVAKKCPHCGGVAEYSDDENSVCVYCGNFIG